MRRAAKHIGIQIVYFVALLALIEVTIRATGAHERCSERADVSRWLVCDPLLGFRVAPDLKPNGKPLNRAGFRTHEFEPKAPGTYQVLALGDSCTFGRLGMGYVEEPYPQRLERLVAERDAPGRVEVLNAGQGGYNSFQGVMLLRTKLRGLQPDLITVRYGWNDLMMALDLGSAREPGPLGIGLEDMLLRTALYGFAKRLNRELRAREQTSVDRARASLEADRKWTPSNSRGDYRRNLRRIAEIGRARGADVWFLTSPRNPRPNVAARVRMAYSNRLAYPALERVQESYNDAMRAAGAELGVRVVDMEALYRERESETLFLPGDIPHPNQAGHDIEAEALYRELVAQGIVESRP